VLPAWLIAKKRDGLPLARDEIHALVAGYVRGDVPDYQMAALAMAILLRGMSHEETAALTEAMLASGQRLPRPPKTPRPWVDKHSTGGVGDKVSLVLAPLLACCGLAVPMLSGRGLGPTGGTLDKLEAIPGFRTDLSTCEIVTLVDRVGCVITGTTEEIAPADRKLYALRDVTATVPSIPLITASILSKKLAESLDALVLDVKCGSGAFMQSLDQAQALARSLVQTGTQLGLPIRALITDMNQPLGRMAGNAVEVTEAMQTLAGDGPPDLWECTRALAAELLQMTGRAESLAAACQQLDRERASGRPLEKFREMVAAQGGRLHELPRPAPAHEWTASRGGYLAAIDTQQLGLALVELGAGRKVLGDRIDPTVGLEMLVRLGDHVPPGQPILRVFAPRERFEHIQPRLASAFIFSDHSVVPPPLIQARLS
jgi:pyrimidine-nucleoside phosphorylase